MKVTLELKIFTLFLLLIVVSEIITSFVNLAAGLFMDSILMVSLLVLSAFWGKTKDTSYLFLCLSIAPLIRIFSLSLPLNYFPSYAWYLVSAIPLFLAAVSVVRIEGLKLTDLGINLKKPKIQFLVMLTGIPFGILEYFILKPQPVAGGLPIVSVVLLAACFIVATGFVEELVFRGIFLNNAVKVFGGKVGLVSVTAVFSALHVGWLNAFDLLFVFAVGLFFGLLTMKTGSIAGVSLSHGLTNVFLFIIMPSINLAALLTPK